jgi:DNA-binding MarR family transcriptional regulator
MASRLEAAGYARREMDPSDRRRVVLHALPAGVRQAFSLFDSLYQAANDLDSEGSGGGALDPHVASCRIVG